MKKIIIIAIFLLSLTLCSCSSDDSTNISTDESTTNNIDLSKVVCGKTTLYDLKQILGEPSNIGNGMYQLYSHWWLYEDVYFYNLPCDIYFCTKTDNGQAIIYGYEIELGYTEFDENESNTYSSMKADFTEKYWTPEDYMQALHDSFNSVYNITKWDANGNAGEKKFAYIYLSEFTSDFYDGKDITIYFTYEEISKLERKD